MVCERVLWPCDRTALDGGEDGTDVIQDVMRCGCSAAQWFALPLPHPPPTTTTTGTHECSLQEESGWNLACPARLMQGLRDVAVSGAH